MSNLPPIAVFDLDGTLAETAGDLIGTLNVLLHREKLPPVQLDEARDLIGAGAKALIQRGFSAAGEPPSTERLEQLFREFLEHYGDHLCNHTYLYDGLLPALDTLAENGFLLAVCTNKHEAHAVALLDKLDIGGRFAAICGRATFPFFKPDPRHISLTIDRAKGDPSRAVMVGDSRADVDAAKAAGIPVIGVTFGYTDTPIEQLNPDRVISHFDDLVTAVEILVPQERARAVS